MYVDLLIIDFLCLGWGNPERYSEHGCPCDRRPEGEPGAGILWEAEQGPHQPARPSLPQGQNSDLMDLLQKKPDYLLRLN